MITVNTDVNSTPLYAANVEVGTAFLGTVESIKGNAHNGLFIRTANTLFFVEEPAAEFDSFNDFDGEYSPEIKNFHEVDVEVIVTDIPL